MLLDWRPECGPGRQSTREELVGIVDEQFNPRARAPGLEWAGLARVVRVDLVEEERSVTDLESCDATEVPELASS